MKEGTIPSGQMLAAVLYGPRDVRIEEVDVPRIGPGEILAKVEAASVDFTDWKVFLRGRHPMITIPGLFGHEWAGTIVEVGEAVSGRWQPGMRVVAANSAPCLPTASAQGWPSDGGPPCQACRRDRQNMCERLLYVNGAFASYIRLPSRIVQANLYELAPEIPFEEAALSEPLACVVHAVRRILIHPGDTVAVIGCGPIGLLFIAFLKSQYGGRIQILALDHHEDRLERAREFGADFTLDPRRAGPPLGRVNVAIEAVGTVRAHEEALGLLGRGGVLVSFGGIAPGTRMSVDIGRMHYEELQILPIYHHTPANFARAVELIARREIPVGRLITARLPLHELPKALEMVAKRKGLRTIIDPWA